MLVEPGKSFAQVATTVADNGINPGMASFFTGIAISMYCPQMMGSIGNGTFLNMLQQTPGLPVRYRDCRGYRDCPDAPGSWTGKPRSARPVATATRLDVWHFPISPATRPSNAPRSSPSTATRSTST